MASRGLTFFFTLLLASLALAGESSVPAETAASGLGTAQPATAKPQPATQPAKKQEGYRYLENGSWIISQANIRSNGTPATLKRKILVTIQPKTGQRAIEESRWHNNAFEPTGPLQDLADADRRSFDDLGLKPTDTQPDAAITIAHKRYLCSVTTYTFRSEGDGRSTELTLWRDKSGETHLPPRTISINNKEVPLPQDALQADFSVQGPKIATHGQRRITAMASPLRIDNQTCNCLVELTRTHGTSNGRPMSLSLKEWFCHELPGERLRTVTAMNVGNIQVESDVSVVDFHVARAGGDPTAASAVRTGAE
jgi:hypothetical protein